MKYLKVIKKNAEYLKNQILKRNLLDKDRKIEYDKTSVLFPIINIENTNIKKDIGKFKKYKIRIINKEHKEKNQKHNESAKIHKLFNKYKIKLSKGYDILGNIAIIKSGLSKKNELEIANAILKFNPQLTSVVAQAGAVSGIYRLRKFRYVAGIKTFVAEYKENNCIFKFDIRKTFFSNRLSYERARITSQIKKGENICVLFAGIGPFAIEIAKKDKTAKVVGIELNKKAIEYMKNNIQLNKAFNVKPVLGNVKKEFKNYKEFADRIVVPMPKSSIKFLDQILEISKKKSIVHIYMFGNRDMVLEDTKKVLECHAKKNNYTVKILFNRIVRPYSKNEVEIVVDYMINKYLKK